MRLTTYQSFFNIFIAFYVPKIHFYCLLLSTTVFYCVHLQIVANHHLIISSYINLVKVQVNCLINYDIILFIKWTSPTSVNETQVGKNVCGFILRIELLRVSFSLECFTKCIHLPKFYLIFLIWLLLPSGHTYKHLTFYNKIPSGIMWKLCEHIQIS